MIEVHDLHRSFGDIKALQGVSFTAHDGQITGLLGPNGAGKTSSLRVLYGLLKPDRGHASIDGFDIGRQPLQALQNLGAMPHAHGLYDRLTAREHIRYFAELRGLGGKPLEARIQALIEALDMQDIAERRCAGFSEGQSVKIALARATIHEPGNVILDEPTAGLDVMSARKVRGWLRKLRQQGRCVLLSSHLMHEVSELCDQIVIIAKGQVVAHGSPDALRKQSGQQQLEDAFVALIGSDEGLWR